MYVDDSDERKVLEVFYDTLTTEKAEIIAAERRHGYYADEIEKMGVSSLFRQL